MPEKILVVDDDISIVRMIEYKLKTGGFEVICAFDGLEAMEEALENKPTVVIADIDMPGIDGIELARRLKNHPETKDIPIILITARCEDEKKKEAREIEVKEFIAKPFAPSNLLDMVKKMVGEIDE